MIIYIIFAAVQFAQAPDIVNSETVTALDSEFKLPD